MGGVHGCTLSMLLYITWAKVLEISLVPAQGLKEYREEIMK